MVSIHQNCFSVNSLWLTFDVVSRTIAHMQKHHAVQNQFISAALHRKSEWLPMMANQFREWAQDVIHADRIQCADALDRAGEFAAARAIRTMEVSGHAK